MTKRDQELELRILARLLDWDKEDGGKRLSMSWDKAPDFFGMSTAGAGGAAACWDRLYDTLVEMEADGLVGGAVFVNRIEDLKVEYRGGDLLRAGEAEALEAEKTRIAAERDMLSAAQKAAHADREAVLNGRLEVSRGQKALQEGQASLRSERETLTSERGVLDEARAQLADAEARLEERRAALKSEQEDAARKLADERKKLEDAAAARQHAADEAELSAGQWRSAGILAMIIGGMAALFAVTHMGLV